MLRQKSAYDILALLKDAPDILFADVPRMTKALSLFFITLNVLIHVNSYYLEIKATINHVAWAN